MNQNQYKESEIIINDLNSKIDKIVEINTAIESQLHSQNIILEHLDLDLSEEVQNLQIINPKTTKYIQN